MILSIKRLFYLHRMLLKTTEMKLKAWGAIE